MKKIAQLILLCALTLNATAQTKIACIGNSVTYGSGIANSQNDSYPAQLQQLLGEKYIVGKFARPGATLLFKGHNPYINTPEWQQAKEFNADIAIIHLGLNDTDPRNWPEHRDSFAADYSKLIDTIIQANKNCRVIIARMSPIFDRHRRFESSTRDWYNEIQTHIEAVAAHRGVELIDFQAPLQSFPHLLPDALHPNKEGAAILASVVYSAITGDYGGLKMPMTYSDNMVLQRDTTLTLQGIANAQEQVVAKINGQKVKTITDGNGKWSLQIQPLAAGGPYELNITTKTSDITYKNVLVGEVWLCSGQSNMGWILRNAKTAKEDITEAKNDNIRLLNMVSKIGVPAKGWRHSEFDSINMLGYYEKPQWEVSTPQSAAQFSAVAYHFGKMLYDSLNVPIGLICNAVGGSPTEAWIDRKTVEEEIPAILRNWPKNDFVLSWVRDHAALNLKTMPEGRKMQRHPYDPCYLYESGIEPLAKFPIKGVIWYQGESNAHNIKLHEKLFKMLVNSWRGQWGNEELPFYYVQLSSISNRLSWPQFRDSQRRLMDEIPFTAMAVCSDIGDSTDVHPRAKKEVGQRLARWALHNNYGNREVIPSGPMISGAKVKGNSIVLDFKYGKGLKTSNTEAVATFEVAENEGFYAPAKATIEGDKIKLSDYGLKNPKKVRYGWQAYSKGNLVNEKELPASTFCIDIK